MDNGLAIAAASLGALPAFSPTATAIAGQNGVNRQKFFLIDFNGLNGGAGGGAENDLRFSEIRSLTGINSRIDARSSPMKG
jgi:hypothetical protein